MLTVAHSQWNVKKKEKEKNFNSKEKKLVTRDWTKGKSIPVKFLLHFTLYSFDTTKSSSASNDFPPPRVPLAPSALVFGRESPGSAIGRSRQQQENKRMKQWDTEARWKRLQLREFGETDVHPSRISNVSFFFLFFQMQPSRKDAFRIRTPSRRGELEKSWGEKSRGMATLIKRHQSRYSMSSRLQCSRRLLKYLTSRTHKTKSYTGAIDEAIIIGCLLVPLLLY